MLNTRDEQVISTFAPTEAQAIQNALYCINLDELDHWTLDRGVFVDGTGETHYDLHDEYMNSVPLFSTGGASIVVPSSSIYIDKIEIIKQPVTIRRGDLIDYLIPWKGGEFDGRGVAWSKFQTQHGTGWVLVDENNPSKNASIYEQNITAVDRVIVEYNEDTNELFRNIWDDDNEEAGA